MHRRGTIAGLLFLCLALTGAGLYVLTRFKGPPEHRALTLVPQELEFYLDVFIEPSTEQQVFLRSMESATDDVAGATGSALDDLLRFYGLDPEQVRPWLGREIAIFGLPYKRGNGLLLEVEGAGGDSSLSDEIASSLPENHRFEDGFVAVGDKEHLAAFAPESPLADSRQLEDVTGSLFPEDRLAFGLGTRSKRFVEMVRDVLPVFEVPARLMEGLTSWTLSADEDRLVIDGYAASDGAALFSGKGEPPHMGELPSDAWLAGEIINTDHSIDAFIDMLEPGGRSRGTPEPFDLLVDQFDGSRFALGGDSLLGLEATFDADLEDGDAAQQALIFLADHLGLGIGGDGNELHVTAPRPFGDMEFRFEGDRLTARRGSTRSQDSLADVARFTEAEAWVAPWDMRGYIDTPRARKVLGFFFTGEELLTDVAARIGRVAVGVGSEDRFIESRIVIEIE